MYFPQFLTSPMVRRWTRTLSLSLGLVLVVSGAMAQSAPAAPATTTVLAHGAAGVVITLSDIISDLQRAPEATRQIVMSQPESIQQMVSNLLVRRVLAAEAERDGLGSDPIVAATIAIARDRALSDARLMRLDVQNAPSEAAIEAYARNLYQVNAAKFEMPAQTRARHILLANSGADSLGKAKALLAQLRAGASFEELAKANSTDPGSAVKGGDLGFFPAGKMVRPFEDAVNALAKPGDLSEPVESQFGYHIIRLEERKEKGRQPYEDVRPQLIEEARTTILNQARVSKVQSLNKDFVIDKAAIEALTKPAAR
jgi:peptidyl-prolyl cis-trans isomerase C